MHKVICAHLRLNSKLNVALRVDKGNIVGDPKIDEFLEELERDHGIRLKRLPVTSVVAV